MIHHFNPIRFQIFQEAMIRRSINKYQPRDLKFKFAMLKKLLALINSSLGVRKIKEVLRWGWGGCARLLVCAVRQLVNRIELPKRKAALPWKTA